MYYRHCTFTISEKQSDYINDRIYADKKLPKEKKEFISNRSEYIRKLIQSDMKLLPFIKIPESSDV